MIQLDCAECTKIVGRMHWNVEDLAEGGTIKKTRNGGYALASGHFPECSRRYDNGAGFNLLVARVKKFFSVGK